MRESEKFSEDSRRKIVMEVLSGTLTKEQARNVYGIKSKSAILEWMRIFAGLERRVPKDPFPILRDMSEKQDSTGELKGRIRQLEEELKLSRLKGRAYQIMVDIAKEEYGLDLEKKSGAKQFKDSEKKNRR
jgi:transposase-like protein